MCFRLQLTKPIANLLHDIQHYFDEVGSTVKHVVWDENEGDELSERGER